MKKIVTKIVLGIFFNLLLFQQSLMSATVEQFSDFEEVKAKIRKLKTRYEEAQTIQDNEDLIASINDELQLAIWGGDKGHKRDVYQSLLKYVVHLYGKYRLVSIGESYLERDNFLQITVAFTVQPNFYDHACLLCDSGQIHRDKKSPILYFDVSLNEGSTKSGVAVKSGMSSVDYKVKRFDAAYVVENFLLRSPLDQGTAHDLVQFYPYKTFYIRSDEKIRDGLEYLYTQSEAPSTSYSILGNNCISFIAKALYRFGVFKETYDENAVLRYVAEGKYQCHGGLPFVYDGLVRMLAHSPEWLKELVDNNNMVKIEGKSYSAALSSTRNPVHSKRSGNCLVELDDILRSNLGEIFLRESEEKYIPKKEAETRNSLSAEPSVDKKKNTCLIS